jgi:hypothetical protein
MTAMIVLSCSREVRDLLKSLSSDMGCSIGELLHDGAISPTVCPIASRK